MSKGTNAFPMRSPQRDVGVAHVRFNTAAGTPTMTDDAQDLVASISAASGVYTMILNQRWFLVRAFPTILDTDPQVQCKALAGVEGLAAANTVVIQIERENNTSGVSAVDDPTSEEVDVFIFLR